ncbi:MAG: hypothetical protein ACI8XI_000890 [Woeseiaceae bacterium]|jgi:hypothetical protein|tara:strand:- start:25906 stop:26508 length:603 start_codon:yes stop_codon:yes gene_type:complete
MNVKYISTLVLLTFFYGCSSQVKIDNPNIPKLLITQAPFSVAIKYPDNFNNFLHEEKVIGKKSWQVDFSNSNRLLFNEIFQSFFEQVSVLENSEDNIYENFNFTIMPSIDAIEFSVPEQSQDETFSVWIRYRVKIFDFTGMEIINWPISAYGKTSTTTFSDDKDLANAAILAMRDAAALIVLQLEKTNKLSPSTQQVKIK